MQIRTPNRFIAALAVALGLFVHAGCTSPSEDPAPSVGSEPTAETAPPPAAQPAAPATSGEGELFVDIEAEPDEGAPPLAVQFTATVEDNTGAVECEWDFGDGSPKKRGLNPMHVFSTVEDYEIIARCKDATGFSGEGEVDVFVESD